MRSPLNFASSPVVSLLMVAGVFALPAYSQTTPPMNPPSTATQEQAGADGMAGERGDDEIAHPFFTHMGISEKVGVYSFRLVGLANRVDGGTRGDFGFHLETGLTERIGLHIRNDSFLHRTRSEAMFQFLVIKSRDGMSGFAPIIEFEFPTRSGGGSRINTLAGFSSALVSKRAAFNQVVHYNPREDSVDYSFALVARAGKRYFPIVEVLGEGARGERPLVNLLGGLKIRVNENLTVGFAVQIPVTRRKDFSSQLVLGPDIEWKTN